MGQNLYKCGKRNNFAVKCSEKKIKYVAGEDEDCWSLASLSKNTLLVTIECYSECP